MYTINGKILSRNVNGQIRVAIETIKELDKIVPEGEFEIVAPFSKFSIEGLKNIRIIRFGMGNAHIWEQTYYVRYLIANKRVGINFLNSHPIVKPDICYIHDILFNAYPKLYCSFYGRLQKRWNLLMQKAAAQKAKRIITVSQFSKFEIEKYYPKIESNKISVIYNGWQHFDLIDFDDSVYNKVQSIRYRKFVMAASGLTPQKNFNWIIENAKCNPDYLYVIVGNRENSTQLDIENTNNIVFTGRLSDSEMKTLMRDCEAFIHPAIYEGFGLTPLEAIASGCRKIIVSNAACLPEIYGDCAIYIDPQNPEVALEGLLKSHHENPEILLKKYSWENAAKELLNILNS